MHKLSVIVCTYNREEYIGKCLKHLANQSIPTDQYQVVVVNNNSPDNTESVCQSVMSAYPDVHWTYVVETNQGHTYARNRGITESTAPLLAFIDDDAFVYPNYVESITGFFDITPDAKACGGKIIPVYEGTPPRWMSKPLFPLVAALDRGESIHLFKGNKYPIGANMAYRSEVFEKYGHFDVALGRRGTDGLEGGDEKEVFLRLKKDQASIYYLPTMKVDHIIPDKRLQMSYIKGLAYGVATSEKKRLGGKGTAAWLGKIWSECIKSAGTLVLSIGHILSGNPAKAKMLIKFRYWIVSRLLSRASQT